MARILTPALRAVMGDWIYFVATMRLADVAERVGFAHEIHPNEALNELIQRQLNKGRAKRIARYLVQEDQRFFNALVVGVYGGDPCWYDFAEISPQRGNSDVKIPEDAEDTMGFLSFTGEERLFALDGQHRLAGIKRALSERKDLGLDRVAVIFVAHRSGEAGLQRTRRLFTVLNKTAKAVLKGDIIALDEDDVMAICTRRLVDHCTYFNRGQVGTRLQNSLPPGDKTSWTTITTTYDMLTILFTKIYPNYSEAAPRSPDDLKSIRPDDDILDKYYNFAVEYFRLMSKYRREIHAVFEGETPAAAVQEHRHAGGGSVLYRPLGQKIFIQVVSELSTKYSLKRCLQRLGRVPMLLEDAPFCNVIWDPSTATMTNSATAASLAKDLVLCMLKEETRLSPAKLLERYAKYLGKPESDVELPKPVVS
jgi:DNA sulfur modification protein DndB